MQPRTLSATAIKSFEECEAMFNATYIERVREAGGAAADLGTAVHDSCQWWVEEGDPKYGADPKALTHLHDHFGQHAVKYGLDATMVKDGRKMLKDFLTRWQENPPHIVLSTEVKESFTIKSSAGDEIQVNYIWDRGDQHEDGSIEVVDYKTWRKVVDAQDMRQMTQTRLYALSAAIRYKAEEPPSIWVTLDQMRTSPVSVKFTREDNRATWNYLKRVYDRILESDGTIETIGEGCLYCIRKAGCETLARATEVGNIQRLLDDPQRAATKLAELKAAKKATDGVIAQLEEFMEELLEQNQVPELTYDNGVVVKMTVRKTRKPEMERIAKLIGPDLMARYGKMNLTELDIVLAGDDLDDEVKAEIRRHITTTATGKATASFPKR